MEDNPILPGLTEVEGWEAQPKKVERKPSPRFQQINRDQMVMRSIDVEELIGRGHPARAIWEFVGQLDLRGFWEQVKAVEGSQGRPAYDPRLLVSLWIYAYSEGEGSAREIERRCTYDPAYQWLTGLKVVNHHTLSDFRVGHEEAVRKLLAQIIGVLTHEGLIGLERVTQDGTKIQASTSSRSFHSQKTIEQHLETARKHLEEVDAQSESEVKAGVAAAKKRAAREQKERLESALEEFTKLNRKPSQTGPDELDTPDKARKKKDEPRRSEVEPEARKMKQSDGGFAPSYNVQLSVDQSYGIIVGVHTTQSPADCNELKPGLEEVKKNTGELPDQLLVDGGYVTGENIHAMQEMEIDFIGPITEKVTRLKLHGIDPEFSQDAFEYNEARNCYQCPEGKTLTYKGKEQQGNTWRLRYRASAVDCHGCPLKQRCCPNSVGHGRSLTRHEHEPEIASHRNKMATEEAKKIYKLRGQTAEFPNAWIKEKLGLRRFNVRGMRKAGIEAIWACATYNIQQWARVLWRSQWTTEDVIRV
jgi:transposase